FIIALYFGARNVQMCILVVLCQTKNGLPSFFDLSMKSKADLRNTSSTVSMLYFAFLSMPGCGGSGPSSSIFCLPTFRQRGISVSSSLSVAQQCSTLRGPYFSRNAGSLG